MKPVGGNRLVMARGEPQFDVQSCVSYVNMVMLATILIAFLASIVVWTGNQNEVFEWKESVRSLSSSAERAINMTERIRMAVPPINFTRVAEKAVAQDEDSWINATVNAQRTLRSMQTLVQKADQSRMVERYTELAATITRILASPKVSEHIETYSDHLIWLMGAMESPQADSVYNVVKQASRKVSEMVRSPETRRIMDEFLNSDETRQLILETKGLVYDMREISVTANQVVQQVRDSNVVKRVSDLMKEASEEHLLRKAGEIYDSVHTAENRFGHILVEGYDFIKNLIVSDFHVRERNAEARSESENRAEGIDDDPVRRDTQKKRATKRAAPRRK